MTFDKLSIEISWEKLSFQLAFILGTASLVLLPKKNDFIQLFQVCQLDGCWLL